MSALIESHQEFTGFTIVTVLFLAAGGVLVASNRTVGQSARNVFLFSTVALSCIAAIDWFDYVLAAQLPATRMIHIVSMAFTFMVAPAIPVMIANTIFPERHVRWVTIVLVAQALLEVATIFGGFVFWVDESNVYHRGPLYVVYMATYILSAVYLSVQSIRAGRLYQSANMLSILAILLCMGVGVGIQVWNSSVRTTWTAVAMAVLLYFLFYVEMVLRTDALTKLLNRHSYDEFLKRPPLPCAVVLVDLDNFKYVNDTFGHAYGDECLQVLSGAIRKAYGACGLCYRTGGDEFCVVVTKRLDEVASMGEALQDLVAKEQAKDERIPGVSVGYARADEGCADIKDVINAADEHMYEAKRARKLAR